MPIDATPQASDSPVWQDSEEEEEDELPMYGRRNSTSPSSFQYSRSRPFYRYEAVKLVTENQPNIQITVVFTDGDHESVQVCTPSDFCCGSDDSPEHAMSTRSPRQMSIALTSLESESRGSHETESLTRRRLNYPSRP